MDLHFEKNQKDALAEEHKKMIYNFWISAGISRPSANKNDFKRVRIGPKSYASHMKYILEKTQTEVYLEFKDKFPHIKILRLFEKIKPYFVIPARPRDRETCCCKYHVEERFLFKSCMEYRKHTTPNNNEFPVFEHLCDLLNCTLCPKNQGKFSQFRLY